MSWSVELISWSNSAYTQWFISTAAGIVVFCNDNYNSLKNVDEFIVNWTLHFQSLTLLWNGSTYFVFHFLFLCENDRSFNTCINQYGSPRQITVTLRCEWFLNHSFCYRQRSLVKQGDNVLGSVCLSVSALTAEPFDLRPWYSICTLTLTLARLGL